MRSIGRFVGYSMCVIVYTSSIVAVFGQPEIWSEPYTNVYRWHIIYTNSVIVSSDEGSFVGAENSKRQDAYTYWGQRGNVTNYKAVLGLGDGGGVPLRMALYMGEGQKFGKVQNGQIGALLNEQGQKRDWLTRTVEQFTPGTAMPYGANMPSVYAGKKTIDPALYWIRQSTFGKVGRLAHIPPETNPDSVTGQVDWAVHALMADYSLSGNIFDGVSGKFESMDKGGNGFFARWGREKYGKASRAETTKFRIVGDYTDTGVKYRRQGDSPDGYRIRDDVGDVTDNGVRGIRTGVKVRYNLNYRFMLEKPEDW